MRYPITPTGLHYLIIHFDLPEVTPADWRLSIGGLVSQPLRLSLDDLRLRPSVTLPVTMECAGNGRALLSPRSTTQPWLTEGVSTAEWTGTPLNSLLDEAGIAAEAKELIFTALDWGVQGGEVQPYQRSLTLDEAMRDEVLLVYEMNGEALPPQHGFPLRLLAPDWYGMASVKWLASIEAVAEPFEGYQMTKSYRYAQSQDDPGEPVTLKRPRALAIPPGIPDFASRLRVVRAGRVPLKGRAWSGRAGIARVEVSIDRSNWTEARLERPVSELAWRGWSFDWDATPGRHLIFVRATDENGNAQPNEPDWNFQGMGNNAVYPLEVLVV
jgi:DMSO/TMAO reductase YedYZ molybdopterin-dependent catalytic subunit